jgi:hypothetical protein
MRIRMKCRHPHYCPDWDYAWVRPGDPEMECCTCYHEWRPCWKGLAVLVVLVVCLGLCKLVGIL